MAELRTQGILPLGASLLTNVSISVECASLGVGWRRGPSKCPPEPTKCTPIGAEKYRSQRKPNFQGRIVKIQNRKQISKNLEKEKEETTALR